MRRIAPCLLVLLFATPAAAQEREPQHHVAVLSVGGDAPPSVAREAREAVAVALERDGLRVFPEGDLALRFPPSRLAGCDSIACAWSLAGELGVSMIAAVATWRGEGGAASVTVSLVVGEARAHAATEDVGDGGLAAAASRATRGAQDARRRALLVEGSASAEPVQHEEEEPAAPVARERGLEEYVLPTVLGVVGLALTAAGVYALLPEQCDLRAPSGVCLRGNGPNVGLGAVLAVTGGLSIAGAIVWLIVGGLPSQMGRIDVVLGPDGGGLGWRGTF